MLIAEARTKMKKFFSEFKKFINRGNVVDLSVGVMIGSSFTAIVNGLSNFILKPLVNYLIATILGGDSISSMHTYLSTVYAEDGTIDLSQSIYIDWSSFISVILNFIIIAFVLFCIVKIINRIRDDQKEFAEKIAKSTLDRAERRELRDAGISIRDKAAVKAYFDAKEERVRAEDEKKKAEEAEAAKRLREENPTTEDLLKLILAEMRK